MAQMLFNPNAFTAQQAKPMPVVLVLDNSGSMSGDKIRQLNASVHEMIETFKQTDCSDVSFKVAIITFGTGIHLQQEMADASSIQWEDIPISDVNTCKSWNGKWDDAGARGTPLGATLKIVKSMIEDRTIIPSRAYRPAVVLVSDGHPTDSWNAGDLPTFYIVCDTSGSMSENGKRMQVRTIARTIEQYIRLGYGNGILKLVLWNETASLVEWNPDEDFPERLFECYGSTNADTLCALFDSAPEGKIILLTDCCWSKEAATVLKRWQRKLSPDALRIIKIGTESGLLPKQGSVFSSDEILPMLDGWRPLHNSAVNNDEADEW